ncbi:MAG: hypothetical protein WB765_19485 [Acidimicrobiales bacterium]
MDYGIRTRISPIVARIEGSSKLLEQPDEVGAVPELLAVELSEQTSSYLISTVTFSNTLGPFAFEEAAPGSGHHQWRSFAK